MVCNHILCGKDRCLRPEPQKAVGRPPKKPRSRTSTIGQPKSPWRARKEQEALVDHSEDALMKQIESAIVRGHADQVIKQLVGVLSRASFSAFCQNAWSELEPSTKLEWGRHHELICTVLQALFEDWYQSKLNHDHIPAVRNTVFNTPPGSLKPVHVDGLVHEERKGTIRVGDIVEGDRVLTHKGRFRTVKRVAAQGLQPILSFVTTRGATVNVAPSHPLLTQRGWLPAEQITTKDVLCSVHAESSVGGSETCSLEEARLFGYLIGDGCLSGRSNNFTNQDPESVADFIACAEAVGFDTTVIKRVASYTAASPNRGTHVVNLKAKRPTVCINCNERPMAIGHWCNTCRNKRNQKSASSQPYERADGAVKRWLKKHNLYSKNSFQKRVPAVVMSGSKEIIIDYLAAYWACDGGIQDRRDIPRSKRKNQLTKTVRIDAVTVSHGLALDHHALLQKLGLEFTLAKQATRLTKAMCSISGERIGEVYVSYSLSASDQDTAAKFMQLIGPRLRHEKRTRAPGLTRNKFDQVINPVGIKSITTSEPAECCCLEVEDDSSFVYQGVAVHNSKLISVLFQAWVWLRAPGAKFICISVNEDAAMRDARDVRKLFRSNWYRDTFDPQWQIKGDQDAVSDFGNSEGGGRLSRPSGAVIIGLRGDFLLGDDLNDPEESAKKSERDKVNSLWDTNQYNRVNDPLRSQRICVQQRVHADDHTGYVLTRQGVWSPENSEGWLHVVLPAEFEKTRPAFSLPQELRRYVDNLPVAELRDWRTEEGQVLHPARWTAKWIASEKRRWAGTGSYAGQMQQRPSSEEGGKIKKAWFGWFRLAGGVRDDVDGLELGRPRPHGCHDGEALVVHGALLHPEHWDFDSVILSVDPAVKKTEVGSLWGMLAIGIKGARLFVLDDRSHRGEPDEAFATLKSMVRYWRPDRILVEDKGGGANMIRTLEIEMGDATLPMSIIEPTNPGMQDKDFRVNNSIPHFANGMVFLLEGAPWVDDFVAELSSYPAYATEDRVDCMTQAILHERVVNAELPSGGAWASAGL